MSFTTCLMVALGGALGTIARYVLSVLTMPISRGLPWGTVAINVAGSFVIGFFGTLTVAQGRFPASDNVRLFVMVGLCGGFTTFSAFSLQTLDLMRSGAWVRAVINVAASVVLCILAVALGHYIATRINGSSGDATRVAIESTAPPGATPGSR